MMEVKITPEKIDELENQIIEFEFPALAQEFAKYWVIGEECIKNLLTESWSLLASIKQDEITENEANEIRKQLETDFPDIYAKLSTRITFRIILLLQDIKEKCNDNENCIKKEIEDFIDQWSEGGRQWWYLDKDYVINSLFKFTTKEL